MDDVGSEPDSAARGRETSADERDAVRRTRLASERTQLAWWRTGLTALAVGIGIGRVVPELGEDITAWPYVTLGVAFAVYGVVLIFYGSSRGRAVDAALDRSGYARPAGALNAALASAGGVLGFATAALILFG